MLLRSSPQTLLSSTTEASLVEVIAPAAERRERHVARAGEIPGRFQTPVLRRTLAFTLVEMLVVIAVIGILLGLSLPVFKNIVGGRAVEQSINSVTGIIELARATAISNRTYVWVLFRNVTNADNNAELRCAAVMSLNGLNDYSAANDQAITRLVKLPNVKSVTFANMPLAVQKVVPADLTDDHVYIAGLYNPENTSDFPALVVGGQDFQKSAFIRFGDNGEIATSDDPYNLMVQPVICLGLATTRGTAVQSNASDGAIVAAYGSSSRMRIFRP